jgi:hypothetical protein
MSNANLQKNVGEHVLVEFRGDSTNVSYVPYWGIPYINPERINVDLDTVDEELKKIVRESIRDNLLFLQNYPQEIGWVLSYDMEDRRREAYSKSNVFVKQSWSSEYIFSDFTQFYYEDDDTINVHWCLMVKKENMKTVALMRSFGEPVPPQLLELWVKRSLSYETRDSYSHYTFNVAKALGIPIVIKEEENINETVFNFNSTPRLQFSSIREMNEMLNQYKLNFRQWRLQELRT